MIKFHSLTHSAVARLRGSFCKARSIFPILALTAMLCLSHCENDNDNGGGGNTPTSCMPSPKTLLPATLTVGQWAGGLGRGFSSQGGSLSPDRFERKEVLYIIDNMGMEVTASDAPVALEISFQSDAGDAPEKWTTELGSDSLAFMDSRDLSVIHTSSRYQWQPPALDFVFVIGAMLPVKIIGNTCDD